MPHNFQRDLREAKQIRSKIKYADVAELADALDLGSSVNDVGVQVPSSAPTKTAYPLGWAILVL